MQNYICFASLFLSVEKKEEYHLNEDYSFIRNSIFIQQKQSPI